MKRKVNISVGRNFEQDITSSCPHCEKVLFRTRFTILVTIDERRFVVLNDTPIACCKGEIRVPLGFPNQESATETMDEIIETTRRQGTLDGYEFQELAASNRMTKH